MRCQTVTEGELKKQIYLSAKYLNSINMDKIIAEAKKDFELEEDYQDLLENFGVKNYQSLLPNQIELKITALEYAVKKLIWAKKKWFGDST